MAKKLEFVINWVQARAFPHKSKGLQWVYNHIFWQQTPQRHYTVVTNEVMASRLVGVQPVIAKALWSWTKVIKFKMLCIITSLLFSIILLSLIGCGTSVKPTVISTAPSPIAKLCEDTAEVIFKRDNNLIFWALEAIVQMDGFLLVKLSRDEQFSKLICQGNHSISASWNGSKPTVISAEFLEGAQYTYSIAPNSFREMTNGGGLFGINLTQVVLPEKSWKYKKVAI